MDLLDLSVGGVTAEELYRCVHCGLCLNQCPTYLELGLETESPRGRLALMKAVAEGRFGYTDRLVEHMELCLLCRACEAACPSGVPFGSLMTETRARIEAQTSRPFIERTARNIAFKHLFPHQGRLGLAFRMLSLYQASGYSVACEEVAGVEAAPDSPVPHGVDASQAGLQPLPPGQG